jgi:hypothetical protein
MFIAGLGAPFLILVDICIHGTIILPEVLYGCVTWSPTLRVLESRVLRRIFGPKRDEVTGGWRKLLEGELRDLYSSPSIIRMMKSRSMRLAGHVARMREKRTGYGLLVGPLHGLAGGDGVRSTARPGAAVQSGVIYTAGDHTVPQT